VNTVAELNMEALDHDPIDFTHLPGGQSRELASAKTMHGPSRYSASTVHGHLVPEPAVEVEVVAEGLAGGGVAGVGVQRVPVVSGLGGAVGPLDRAQLAGDARACRGGPDHRCPVPAPDSVPARPAPRVRAH